MTGLFGALLALLCSLSTVQSHFDVMSATFRKLAEPI
jgi:hypothetical protein